MSLPEEAYLALLLAWSALAVATYTRPGKKVSLRDVFHLIPRWNFFAPRPLEHDYYVVYRDRLKSGAFTQWCELLVIKRPSAARGWLWNPHRRTRKALIDIISELMSTEMPVDRIFLSSPYLVLLERICSLRRSDDAEATQFAILARYHKIEDDRFEPVFLSHQHSLD